jgi:redox-sensitive bicupin YhaK (pirin superfamily)
MITVRPSDDRGLADHGWLLARHSFSFADYQDPDHDQFRALRVLNEDRVAPGAGFPTHGHRDMEIITVVLEGALQHRDSMGHSAIITPGEVQVMTAGTGVQHSEFNPSATEAVHLLQIWLLPRAPRLTPAYGQRRFPEAARRGRLQRVASGRDSGGESLRIHADADLFTTLLAPDEAVIHPLAPGRHAWVQVARGAVRVNGKSLVAGDGAALSDEAQVLLRGTTDAEVLLFDLG